MITTELIDKLIKLIQYNNLTVATIEKISCRSRRNLLNDIDQMNDLFIDYDIKIIIDENEILRITEFDIQNIIEKIFLNNEFLFQQERPYMVILYIFLKQEFVSVNHFQELLQMSKNSVLSDITEANDISQKNRVEIKYTRKHGYELIGDDLNIRQLINSIVTSILNFSTGKKIIEYIVEEWKLSLEISVINKLLAETNEISFVNERLEDIIYLISILEIGPVIEDKDLTLKEEELSYIENSKTYGLTKNIIKEFPRLKTQEFYITIQLLSVIQGNLETDQIDYFKEMLEEIIVNVQGYAGSIFPNTETFRRNLYNHLVPSYFRMRFQVQLNNPLKEQILNDYPNLFYLIKRSLEPLSNHSDFEVTDDEIAYFVMHFGSYFSTSIERENKELNAIVLCPHGMGTSLLLKNSLSNVMPEINFIKHSNESLDDELPDADLIISTIYYESEIPVYLTNPSMSHLEISLLKRKIYEEFNIQTESLKTVDELYEKIKLLSDKHDPLIVKSEMDRVLDTNLKTNYKEIENYEFGPLLTEEMIIQKERTSNWKEAITIASQPLLEFDYINENYIKAMINTVKEYGPYIVLVPQVAMPHAKPIDGSHKLGVSLLQLGESVMFKRDDGSDVPVKLLFVVSISDKYSHLSILKRINSIIIDNNIVSGLIDAKNKKEILKIISENDSID